jgi:spore maturation protein CgeB
MKCNKVLLIAAFKNPWNNGWYMKTGLEKNGIEVMTFDPTSVSNPQRSIVSITKEFNPDFILYAKNELPVEAILELKKHSRIIQWYPDLAIPDWLPPYVKAADIFFTMSEGHVEKFRKYKPAVFWLTQAFEPSFFQIKSLTLEDKKVYSSDIAFVGNLGSKPFYLRRRTYLNKVIREQFELTWWGPRMPRKISTIPLLVGSLGRAYGGRFVWGEEYAKIAKLTKIFLAFDAQPHIRKSMSARMYTAVGCGAFYLCEHVDGIEEVLEPGREIVTFHSEDDMISKIRFYLQNDRLRKKIAEAGQRRVLREHTYEIRIREMCDIIEQTL